MSVAVAQEREAPRWGGALVSLLLHGVLAALALFVFIPPSPQDTPEPGVEVELVTPEPAAAPAVAPRPATVTQPVAPSAPENPVTPAPPERARSEAATIKPSRMLAGAALADPRSRKARQALPLLAMEDRAEQLCGLEAMAQVAAWNPAFKPDRIAVHAIADAQITEPVLRAEGAALHSGRDWYQMRFSCTLGADHLSVTGFEFQLGAAIARRDWARYALPASDHPLD